MKNITDRIDPTLFPVEKRVLYWAEENTDVIFRLSRHYSDREDDMAHSDLDKRIANLKDSPYSGNLYKCPRHVALVRLDNGEVFNCVTTDYKLITNEDALTIANYIANIVFKINSWREFSGCLVTGTLSGSQTVYSLWHDHFNVSYKNDRWVPFLRIANSYNSTVSLRYDLGFLIVDENEKAIAIVFESMSMELKDSHASSIEAIKEKLTNIISDKKLNDLDFLTKEFKEKMDCLGDLSVKRKDIFPLYLKMIGAKFDPNKDDSSTLNRYSKISKRLNEITDRFFEESDAYYFMKVIAYYVNNPISSKDDDENTQSQNLLSKLQLQKGVGDFIDEIIKEVCRGHKKLTEFVGDDNYKRAAAVEAFREIHFI